MKGYQFEIFQLRDGICFHLFSFEKIFNWFCGAKIPLVQYRHAQVYIPKKRRIPKKVITDLKQWAGNAVCLVRSDIVVIVEVYEYMYMKDQIV